MRSRRAAFFLGKTYSHRLPEKPMATKPIKTKSKRLLADVAQVRTAEPRRRTRKGVPDFMAPALPYNPALTIIAMMGRVMGAYAEFPARLAQCRSPMDIWFEQASFVQRHVPCVNRSRRSPVARSVSITGHHDHCARPHHRSGT